MSHRPIPTVALNEATRIPILGFDTQGLDRQLTYDMTVHALEVGFRHLELSDHESDVVAIKKSIRETKVSRQDLFLSSKVWWNNLSRKQLRHSFEETLRTLGVEYLDLYMIHWPNRTVLVEETLREMQALVAEGKLKAIGVCNFSMRHLDEARATGVEIVAHQFELHPTFVQNDMLSYCRTNDIAVMALSPFGEGKDLALPLVNTIAKAHLYTEAQVLLIWARARGWIVTQGARMFPGIDEYRASLDLTLSNDELAKLDAVAQRERLINPPFADFGY